MTPERYAALLTVRNISDWEALQAREAEAAKQPKP
jgi:hypothetical protein